MLYATSAGHEFAPSNTSYGGDDKRASQKDISPKKMEVKQTKQHTDSDKWVLFLAYFCNYRYMSQYNTVVEENQGEIKQLQDYRDDLKIKIAEDNITVQDLNREIERIDNKNYKVLNIITNAIRIDL